MNQELKNGMGGKVALRVKEDDRGLISWPDVPFYRTVRSIAELHAGR